MALQKKNNEVMDEWFKEMKGKTYIRVDNSFKNCATFGEQTSQR